MRLSEVRTLLDGQVAAYDRDNLFDHPDPLMIAREVPNEYTALVCALFAYGNARAICRFLVSVDFSLLDASEPRILKELAQHYYRFQTPKDVQQFFLALRRVKQEESLNDLFLGGYAPEENVLDGIAAVIRRLEKYLGSETRGLRFLLGTAPDSRRKGASTLKRWNMYLRWMVRNEYPDLGLWAGVKPAHLLMPLDTHTFQVARKLKLLKRKQYDLQAAVELTETLRKFAPEDPVRYDFALYRIGQKGGV